MVGGGGSSQNQYLGLEDGLIGTCGGGGGGSFVYETSSYGWPTLLTVGGGGGGAGLNVYSNNPSAEHVSGQVFVPPVSYASNMVVAGDEWVPMLMPYTASGTNTDYVIPATRGTGFNPGATWQDFRGGMGATNSDEGAGGAGGGGWRTAGGASATPSSWSDTTPSAGGGGYLEGFAGGASGTRDGLAFGGKGGFGGGGAGEYLGGGGGYNGGGGSYGYGGNGGSFVAYSALSESAQQSFQIDGNGQVVISLIRADLGSGNMVAYDTGVGEVAGEVVRLYETIFNRAPDPTGLGYWISQVDSGTVLDTVATVMLASSEYQTLYGTSVSNTQFVTNIYDGILDRSPDSSGEAYWLQQLANGTSRAQLVVSISESAEAVQHVEQTLLANGISYQLWVG